MMQVLIHMLDRGLALKDAIEAPRVATYAFPGSFAPNKVLYEADLPEPVIAELKQLGHDIEAWPASTWKAGGVCVALSDASGTLSASADQRRAGTADVVNQN